MIGISGDDVQVHDLVSYTDPSKNNADTGATSNLTNVHSSFSTGNKTSSITFTRPYETSFDSFDPAKGNFSDANFMVLILRLRF